MTQTAAASPRSSPMAFDRNDADRFVAGLDEVPDSI
jgi:hypothetical protein